VLYEIHPCTSPLRGQLSCSNEFQTHLSNTYVGRLHCVLSALSDTKIVSSSGRYERKTSPKRDNVLVKIRNDGKQRREKC